jgi:hypothetical protein
MTPVAAPARRVVHRSHVSEEWRSAEVFIGSSRSDSTAITPEFFPGMVKK